jgi:predicted  nucleic acid-binding Zn-ribbon protein
MKVEDLESSVEVSATANQGMVTDTFKVNKMKVELEILQNDYKALEEDKNKYKTKLAQTETDLSLSRSRLEEIELLL